MLVPIKSREIRVKNLLEQIMLFDMLNRVTNSEDNVFMKDLKREYLKLKKEVERAETVLKLMDETMAAIAESRYVRGDTWQKISDDTGLTLQRLYQYNREIIKVFRENGCGDLVEVKCNA